VTTGDWIEVVGITLSTILTVITLVAGIGAARREAARRTVPDNLLEILISLLRELADLLRWGLGIPPVSGRGNQGGDIEPGWGGGGSGPPQPGPRGSGPGSGASETHHGSRTNFKIQSPTTQDLAPGSGDPPARGRRWFRLPRWLRIFRRRRTPSIRTMPLKDQSAVHDAEPAQMTVAELMAQINQVRQREYG
jgi:hypothetical protein